MSANSNSTVTDSTSVALDARAGVSTSGAKAVGVFHVQCHDAQGNLEWETTAHNALANEGANYLRDCLFKTNSIAGLISAAPVIGLLTATPTAASTLTSVAANEAPGTGYSRKTVTWVGTTTGNGNNIVANGGTAASWTAGSNWTAVTHLFTTDASSGTTGKFLTYASLNGGPYTVNNGSTLTVTYNWTVS